MIPIKKGIESTGQPAVSIESGDSSIPRKPILVEGGPAPEPITVTALTVTENGTYPAPEGSAYSPVTVNVPPVLPSQILESDWDILLREETGLHRALQLRDSDRRMDLLPSLFPRFIQFRSHYTNSPPGE